MNIKLLRKVAKHFLAQPKRLNMDFIAKEIVRGPDAPKCGTVGCIAGWSSLLANRVIPPSIEGNLCLMDWGTGQKALQLTDRQSRILFNEPWLVYGPRMRTGEMGWPIAFAKRYLEAKTARQRAKVTAERIEHFIRTRGKE
jgi:hypothetical protein